MSLAATYAYIEQARHDGLSEGLSGKPPRSTFRFPNEQRAYEEGYRAGTLINEAHARAFSPESRT